MQTRRAEINGWPGALYLDAEERLWAVVALGIAGDQVISLRTIVNPDKLAHLGPAADLNSLLGTSPR